MSPDAPLSADPPPRDRSPDDRSTNDRTTAADPESAAVVDPAAVAEAVYGGERFETISRYRDILASRGIDWGLLGPREVDRLWERHILNSAAVGQLIPAGSTVADVGSGAGLPGIPLAVLRPELSVELIEPLLRRSTFLSLTIDELGMTGSVIVRRTRAEDVQQTYDVVVSRALAPLDRLIRWCRPLAGSAGQLLAIKGAAAAEELAQHARLIARSGLWAELLQVSCDPRIDPTTVVRLRLR